MADISFNELPKKMQQAFRDYQDLHPYTTYLVIKCKHNTQQIGSHVDHHYHLYASDNRHEFLVMHIPVLANYEEQDININSFNMNDLTTFLIDSPEGEPLFEYLTFLKRGTRKAAQ